jgi:guanidinoacetate N-methyltransferase
MKVVRESDERFSIAMELLDDSFIDAPGGAPQRRKLVERALSELGDQLGHLDGLARRLVPGPGEPLGGHSFPEDWRTALATYTQDELVIEGHEVMQAWEEPLMRELATHVAASGGDVLEIGFGMGISATIIQDVGVRSHTIVEPNDGVVAHFEAWRRGYPGREIRLLHGFWQDLSDRFGEYDGVLYDPYPFSPEDDKETDDAFFALAARVLRPTGVLSYYTDEVDSLSRSHQRSLLAHFGQVEISVMSGLSPPPDCSYWHADSMVVVRARHTTTTAPG